MKTHTIILALLLLAALVLGCLAACGTDAEKPAPTTTAKELEFVDYAASLAFNKGSFTKKLEVTVKNFVDGDTVHFNVPESEIPGGVLKGRFLAINTPESTGRIEPYGKAASNFTKERLKTPSPSSSSRIPPAGTWILPAIATWFGSGTRLRTWKRIAT